MSWANQPINTPVVKKGANTAGYKLGDKVAIQQGTSGVPVGLLLALTTEPLYYAGVTTQYGFKGLIDE